MKVVAWGTFDGLHAGHLEFLRRASELGDLYVLVIPDEAVIANKGRSPLLSEEDRRSAVAQLPFVQGCFVDCIETGLQSLSRIEPQVFCLGYDQQTTWEERLCECVRAVGLKVDFVRLDEYAGGIHSRYLRHDRAYA